MSHPNEHTTLLGTVSGTALTVAVNISSQDYIKTAILATVGAIVSFAVTLLLKWLVKKWKD